MGTINIYDRLEFSSATGAVSIGNLSRPLTITTSSNLHFKNEYSVNNDATQKIYDETLDLADPTLVRIEWADGPVELSWGEDTAASDSDTSSFVTNDAVGGFMYLWGNGMYSQDGDKASQRNSNTANGATNVGIQAVWLRNKSGAAIKVRVDAFK